MKTIPPEIRQVIRRQLGLALAERWRREQQEKEETREVQPAAVQTSSAAVVETVRP